MGQFRYQGHASNGQPVEGNVEASSPSAVASQLMGQGVTPVRIEETFVAENYLKKILAMTGGQGVPTVELIMFSRQMYTVIRARIPLTKSIRGLSAGIRHQYFREVLNDIVDKLESGMELSIAMRGHPKVFNDLYVSMIEVGESSGKLDEVFKQISSYLERDDETKKRIKSAMRYPSFVFVTIIFAVVVVNIFVVPAFAAMFANFNSELPFVTKILIFMSDSFVNYWHIFLVTVCLAVFATSYYLKTPDGALLWGRVKIKLPIIGDIIDRASMARYSRSFSLMLNAGVPISQSIMLCSAAIDNVFLEKKIRKIKEDVERGESLMRTHQNANMFTPLVLQMISVGEESGKISELLENVSEFYERELDYDLKTLADRIEPVLIITMALFVAILALGIFLPMWSMFEIQR